MSLLEDVKRIVEKATGWKRPDDPQALLRERKPRAYRWDKRLKIIGWTGPKIAMKAIKDSAKTFSKDGQ